MSGNINSVNTNAGAMIALESLNATNSALQTTENEISTGLRVPGANADGAAFAVAQGVRSDVGALTSANQQLGNMQGLLSTTTSALTDVSNTMNSMRQVLVKLADGSTDSQTHNEYISQYDSLLANVKSFIQDAAYNNKTLVGDIASSSGTQANVNVVRNENGATYCVADWSGSALYHSIAFTSTALASATSVQGFISTTGTFLTMIHNIGSQLNSFGAASSYVNNQITYNSNKIDALNSGLGSLIDADMAKESANLQALQIRQQLGTQALSIANQAPSSLLSLFK